MKPQHIKQLEQFLTIAKAAQEAGISLAGSWKWSAMGAWQVNLDDATPPFYSHCEYQIAICNVQGKWLFEGDVCYSAKAGCPYTVSEHDRQLHPIWRTITLTPPKPEVEIPANDVLPPKFNVGDFVKKISGSQWRGFIVGTYSTELTPEGYAVESCTETGSVQIYPAKALRFAAKPEGFKHVGEE